MMVDGYGNIYAPLLPLLIPRLDLSLAAAGTLTMLFQLAASVAQVGFGRLADRWKPRVLVMVGPVVAVSLLSLIGLAHNAGDAGADPGRRWTGRGGVPSARRRARPPPRRRAARVRDVGLHHRRNARVLAGSADVRAVRAAVSASSGRRCWRSRACVVVAFFLTRVPPFAGATRRRAAGFRDAAAVRQAARACSTRSSCLRTLDVDRRSRRSCR